MSKSGKSLPPQQQRPKIPSSTRVERVESVETYIGPIPHPDQLAEFNALIPDGAHRIMTMAEQAQTAQISRSQDILRAKEKAAQNEHDEIMRGQLLFFILCMLALIAGVVLILMGMSWQGIIVASVPLVKIVSTLITRGKSRND